MLLLPAYQCLEEQIKTTETTLEEFLTSCKTTILSIPGISVVLGAMIMGEIGDISRFGSPTKLLAFGLRPYCLPVGTISRTGVKAEQARI